MILQCSTAIASHPAAFKIEATRRALLSIHVLNAKCCHAACVAAVLHLQYSHDCEGTLEHIYSVTKVSDALGYSLRGQPGQRPRTEFGHPAERSQQMPAQARRFVFSGKAKLLAAHHSRIKRETSLLLVAHHCVYAVCADLDSHAVWTRAVAAYMRQSAEAGGPK